MKLRKIESADTDKLVAFFAELPLRDRTFLDARVDHEAIARWPDDGFHRWLYEEEDVVLAYLALIPKPGYSSHVASLRLVVAESARGRGLGTELARQGLLEGLRLSLRKITVEVAVEREGDISMFTSIGFRPEALLEDHMRDSDGNFHDLVVLSHAVAEVEGDLHAIGADEALGLDSGAR